MTGAFFMTTFAEKRYGWDIGCPVAACEIDMVLQIKDKLQINHH